jgi:HAD superfamily hydrolase (TIGR01450 family)
MTAHSTSVLTDPLAATYDVALFDLDGVVYVGPDAVPHAVAAIASASALGQRAAYVTNNAARPPGVVGDHLRSLGIPCTDEDVVTSAQAAARVVADLVPPGSAVLVVGGAGLEAALRAHDLRPVHSLDDVPAAVVQGFSPDLTWAALAEGAYALATGLPWVASNLDLTVPTVRGIAPGNGTLVAALQAATGRTPEVAGKPLRPLFDTAVERTGATRPLVVGDRLDTDIEGAVRAGLDSLLVMTGVTRPEQAVLAPPHQRATYVGRDLRALLEPPLVAHRESEVWRCGGWVSLVERSRVLVVPAPGAVPADLDESRALTAACAAAAAYDGPLDGVDGLPQA